MPPPVKENNTDNQTKEWNGQLLFGPHNWQEWKEIYTTQIVCTLYCFNTIVQTTSQYPVSYQKYNVDVQG